MHKSFEFSIKICSLKFGPLSSGSVEPPTDSRLCEALIIAQQIVTHQMNATPSPLGNDRERLVLDAIILHAVIRESQGVPVYDLNTTDDEKGSTILVVELVKREFVKWKTGQLRYFPELCVIASSIHF